MRPHVNWYDKPSTAPPDTRTSVVTSRVRMARNISGIPFPSRMSLDDYLSLRSKVFNLLSDRQFVECRTGYGFGYQRADFLISDEGNESPSVAYGNPLTGQTVVIGDEDHLQDWYRLNGAQFGIGMCTDDASREKVGLHTNVFV